MEIETPFANLITWTVWTIIFHLPILCNVYFVRHYSLIPRELFFDNFCNLHVYRLLQYLQHMLYKSFSSPINRKCETNWTIQSIIWQLSHAIMSGKLSLYVDILASTVTVVCIGPLYPCIDCNFILRTYIRRAASLHFIFTTFNCDKV